ncbi:MAG: KAP family P-loop NTPase fold protein [Janthinobacterium lividum]
MLLLAATLFWQPLLKLYNSIIVEPALSKITSWWVSNCVFGLTALLILLFVAAQARQFYRPGRWQLVTFMLPGALYVVMRVYHGQLWGSKWQFTPFSGAPWLYYADVLVLLMVGAGGLWLLSFRQSTKKPDASLSSYLHEDAPMSTDDVLRRGPEAWRLMEQLNALRPEKAFAVGIVGQWGTGKTRFLDLMAQHVPADAIVIRFNPWLVESTAAIRKEFFTTLKEHLGHYSGELAAELSTYANSLAGVYDSTAVKALKEVVSFLSDTPTLTEQFDKVNEVIGRLNRPIFVLIDDIDRLDKDEVLETLRIVRNTANFRRTIFVLAYDKQYVLEAINRTNQANSSQYLDKIMQLEIALPDFDANLLANRTLELVLPAVPEVYRAELTALIGQRGPTRSTHNILENNPNATPFCYYSEIITTMRGAVRFANLFTFDFLPLAGEVRLDEMLNLTLLKLRFPALYDAVKTKRVVDSDPLGVFSSGGAVITLEDEKLTDFYEENKTSKTDQSLGIQVVKHLFSKDELASSERTIQQPSAFSIYFSAGNFANVSLATIARLRTGSPADIDGYLDTWERDDQLAEAFEVLTTIDTFNDHKDFENVVTAGLRAGRRLNQSVLRWLLILNAERESLAKQFYKDDATALATWFESLLASAPTPYVFEAHLVSDLRHEYRLNSSFQFILADKTLGELALRYLTTYLADHPQIDREMFELHWATVNAVDERNYVLTDERANTALRQALEANPVSALPMLLVPSKGHNGEDAQAFQPLLVRIFGSWDKVQGFLQRLPASPEAERIQQDFERFKESGYTAFV